MERITFHDAKRWFWLRTWIWSVPGAVVTVISTYLYAKGSVSSPGLEVGIAVFIGVCSVLLAVLGAWISLQSPWMRVGWRFGFVLNGPTVAVMAAAAAGLVSVAVLGQQKSIPNHPLSDAEYQIIVNYAQIGIGAAGLWGFIFGSWFAMRRDKYFVEPA